MKSTYRFVASLLLFCSSLIGQSKLTLTLHQIPLKENIQAKKMEVIVGRYYDGGFQPFAGKAIPKDSVAIFTFEIPKETPTGLYNIFIGDLSEKEINKAEFIWNTAENLNMDAHFYQLKNGELSIEKSTENEALTKFNIFKNEFETILEKLQKKRLTVSLFDATSKQKEIQVEHEIENIQYNFNNKLAKLGEVYPDTYTTKTLIPLTLIPVRSVKDIWVNEFDSYLSFLHLNYFHHVSFNTNSILYHYAFQDKLFFYLSSYCDKNEDGTKNGIDIIMQKVKDNHEISSYVYNLLLKTFIKLENEALSQYVIDKYGNACSLNLPFDELKKLQTMQALSIGGLAPEISLPDKDGKYNSLRDYCTKNKVTILVIWLSWCTRCQSELPKINTLYNKYKTAGLGVYTVSLDEKKEDWLTVTSLHKNWKNVSELVPIKKSSVVSAYNISTTPALYILDSNGNLIGKNVFGNELETLIKSVTK